MRRMCTGRSMVLSARTTSRHHAGVTIGIGASCIGGGVMRSSECTDGGNRLLDPLNGPAPENFTPDSAIRLGAIEHDQPNVAQQQSRSVQTPIVRNRRCRSCLSTRANRSVSSRSRTSGTSSCAPACKLQANASNVAMLRSGGMRWIVCARTVLAYRASSFSRPAGMFDKSRSSILSSRASPRRRSASMSPTAFG